MLHGSFGIQHTIYMKMFTHKIVTLDKMFWQGKKVLLTGHTGFKGSWLSLWLQSLGANCIGFSLAPHTQPSLFEIAQLNTGMVSILGDIRDLELLKKIFKQYQPEIVIHMAAQALVRYSYQEPLETYMVNVMGTINLFEAARLTDSVRAIANVTSDKCYENKDFKQIFTEEDKLGAGDPYSNSKACSELVTQAYYQSYFKTKNIGMASMRAGNVVGGGDWAKDRIVPDIINACIKEENLFLRYPNALRPWQHVLEPLSAYLLLIQRLYELPEYSGAWNFGPDEYDTKTVSWITDYIISYLKSPIKWFLNEKESPYESSHLKLDSSKAKANLGWMPCWSIEKCLDKAISWYQAYQRNEDMFKISLSQIKEFMKDYQKIYEKSRC